MHTILSRRAILNTPVDQNRCFCRLLPCSAAAFPVYRAGRLPQLYFRGLLKVHSRYGPSVCSPPKADFCPWSFSREVSLPYCPGSYRDEPTISRVELSSAGILHPRGAPVYCGWGIGVKSIDSCYISICFPIIEKVSILISSIESGYVISTRKCATKLHKR